MRLLYRATQSEEKRRCAEGRDAKKSAVADLLQRTFAREQWEFELERVKGDCVLCVEKMPDTSPNAMPQGMPIAKDVTTASGCVSARSEF